MGKSFDKNVDQSNIEDETFFHSLLPKNDVDNDNLYYKKFIKAIKEGCKTIAISGKYGIGKTSIINSILEKYKKESIRVSLGNYDKANEKKDIIGEIDVKNIELKILQQIIYTKESKDLPESRFKRIDYSETTFNIVNLIYTLIIFLIFIIFFDNVFKNIIISLVLKILYIKSLIVINIIVYSFIILCNYIIYKILWFLKINLEKIKINYKDLELTINSENLKGSIFNEYLDEIVYFFKKTKTNIFVIEDLDRYGNVSLEVFKQLKELNYMLNENEIIKENCGVIFVYAVRDDLFENCNDRVKFFDSVIPLVSKFSSQNCKEYILSLYEELQNIYPSIEINEQLFSLLSLYINDRRLLINIFMEYNTYLNVYWNNEQIINYTNLFAIIAYKNCNPIDFELKHKKIGDLYNINVTKRKIIDNINQKLKNDIIEIDEKIKKGKNIIIKDITILKKTFLFECFVNYNYSFSYNTEIKSGDLHLNIDDFINKDINLDDFFSKEVRLNGYVITGYLQEQINKLLEKVNNIQYNHKDEEIEKNKILNLIKLNEELAISDLYSNYDIGKLNNDKDENITSILKNELLISLVKNGFITEDFENTITYFKPGSLTKEDDDFLISVEIKKSLDYSYKLNNIGELFNCINLKYFNNKYIYNFDLFDFMMKNKVSTSKFNKILNQFKDIKDIQFDFLLPYSMHSFDLFCTFLEKIINVNNFCYIINNKEKNSQFNDWLKFIIEKINITDYDLSEIKIILEENENLINSISLNNISKLNLIKIAPTFKDYENINNNIVEFLYTNKIFRTNKSLYDKLIDIYEYSDTYKTRDLLNILYESDDFKILKDDILNSVDFENIYLQFEIFDSNKEYILDFINDDNVKLENKKIVLKNEMNQIINICDIHNKELWPYVIENDLIEKNVLNIINSFNEVKNIDKYLQDFIDYIDEFEKPEDIDIEQFKNYLVYHENNDFLNKDKFLKLFDIPIEHLDETKNIDEELVEILINNKKIVFNKINYEYLYKYDIILCNKFVTVNIKKYIEIMTEIDLDDYIFNNLISNDSIELVDKIKILDFNDIDVLEKNNIIKIVKDIIEKKIEISDDLLEKIFKASSEDTKIDFFIYLNEEYGKIGFLKKINDEISIIRNGNANNKSYNNKESYIKLFNYLKNKRIINSVKIKEQKITITFNKTSI